MVRMASSKNSCDPCSRTEMSTVMAIQYCTDCEENLCKDCVKAHSSFKAFASHHLIDSGSLPVETLSVKNSCTKHKEMVLDFFCVDHDCLCCRSCMAETHRICQQVVPVDVASKAVRRSPMLDDVFGTVSSIRETLEKIICNRDENLKSLNNEEADVLRNVSRIKSKIVENLDDLERKVISDLKSSKTKCENQIKSDQATLSKMMESLDEVTSRLNIVSKHGSENQLFILLNSYKWKVSEYNIKIQEILSSIYTSTIEFKQSPQQQLQIESLGSVHIESTPCPIKYKVSKSNQAQVLPTTIQMPTKFEFDFKFDIKANYDDKITSIAVTDDNRLLLCNNLSTKLLVYSDRGEYLQDCTLDGIPWGIAIIPGEDKAVVSLPGQKSIQFVDIKSMKSGGTHSVPGRCHGIAVVGDKICVGGVGKIYILSKQGKTITTITIPTGGDIYYLHPGPQDSVFYTVYNTVGCVKLSGEVRFTCTPDNFNRPRGVTTDRGGNLYVACKDTNNIHRFSPEGNVIDIILDRDKKISNPYGLAFSKNEQILFVTNDVGKSVFAFSCK